MSKRLIGFAAIAGALIVLVGGLGLFYTAYRRVETQVRLRGHMWASQGVVLEKLTAEEDDRLLPFPVTSYLVRYAYPNAAGQMRTGEQTVPANFYAQAPEQGQPIPVAVHTDDPAVSAVNTALAFPGVAGWRAGLALAAALAALMLAAVGASLVRKPAAV